MRTIPTRNWRAAIVLAACVVNWLVCAVFLLQRPAGISFIDEREKMRRDAGTFFINSADPQMFIAERPLYRWNRWHGGEAMAIKVVEFLNWPALAGARAFGAVWTMYAGPRNSARTEVTPGLSHGSTCYSRQRSGCLSVQQSLSSYRADDGRRHLPVRCMSRLRSEYGDVRGNVRPNYIDLYASQ